MDSCMRFHSNAGSNRNSGKKAGTLSWQPFFQHASLRQHPVRMTAGRIKAVTAKAAHPASFKGDAHRNGFQPVFIVCLATHFRSMVQAGSSAIAAVDGSKLRQRASNEA